MHDVKTRERIRTDLAGKQVTHKVFEDGKIIKCTDDYVVVNFLTGRREFVFPDAFETFLTLKDEKARRAVGTLVERVQEKRKAQAAKIRVLKELQEIERRRLIEPSHGSKKIHSQSQTVFWVGENEQDSIFDTWSISTGVIKSGPRAGEPRKLARVGANTACLLTARGKEEPENARRILGAFMMDEKTSTDGTLHSLSDFRIRLSKNESHEFLFWNYYINPQYPHKITWNSGRHRYFDNVWMAQILKDIMDFREDTGEKASAEAFFKHFCRTNRIEEKEIPKPGGALRRA